MDFLKITDRYDLARFFRLELDKLTYFLYKIPPERQYKEFHLKKRKGGIRKIFAPIFPIKELQRTLKDELYKVYTPKTNVHGYVYERGIKTNAKKHEGRFWVAKIDVENFFPSIHFGRVRGFFLKPPFKFCDEVAKILAKLCVRDDKLPQGAPTSPIISNIICRKLDRELIELAARFRCVYTRYADDITFSTTRKTFPSSICYFDANQNTLRATAGNAAREIIECNSFNINESKTSLRHKGSRQMVTGLIVNN